MKFNTTFGFAGVLAVLASFGTTAAAETTLEIVKARGHLRCQVGAPTPGFYNLDSEGNWYGLDTS
ncbi:hypothetical protein JI58_03155 [Marinosulfonomonas sp. PRT-SC04]|nr:hypothetical protein JI58_03155 [Marinosulfonomonas sp. PRT-SC04]